MGLESGEDKYWWMARPKCALDRSREEFTYKIVQLMIVESSIFGWTVKINNKSIIEKIHEVALLENSAKEKANVSDHSVCDGHQGIKEAGSGSSG